MTAAAGTAPARSSGWMLGLGLDLLFVANVAWPLVGLLTVATVGTAASEAFGYLLAYFVIMPHRWITLPLVMFDKQRLSERPLAYLAVLGFVIVLCTTMKLSFSSLAILVAIDYIWNAWHFTAQHSGIERIYFRLGRGDSAGRGLWEKVLLRTTFMYTLLRLTGRFVPQGSSPWLDWVQGAMEHLAWCDFPLLGLPWLLLARDLAHWRPELKGHLIYLLSVSTLYGLLLVGIRYDVAPLILGCAMATTLFHSTEYLAVVSWAVPRNKALSQSRLFAKLLSRWALFLIAFMAFFAVSSYFLRQHLAETWIWININVSLLHYAYDGMIWKRPRGAAAAKG